MKNDVNNVENKNSTSSSKSIFSKISNFRKENSGLFYLIIVATLVLTVIIIILINHIIKKYCSNKNNGYIADFDSDSSPEKISSSNDE